MRRFVPLILAMLVAGAARAADPFDPFAAARIDGAPGAQAPLDGALLDEAGRPVTLRGLSAGRPILLAPVQHRCPNICGVTLEGIARAARSERPGRDVEIVAFGFDPRERPADAAISAQRLQAAFGPAAAPGLHAVTGGPREVAAVTGALGYHYAWDPSLGQYAHAAAVAVLTPQGRLSSWIYGLQPPPELVRAAIAAARGGRIGALGERLLLLCYHYDPVTGRYDSLVMGVLRIGVVASVLILVLLVALSLRRERRARGAP